MPSKTYIQKKKQKKIQQHINNTIDRMIQNIFDILLLLQYAQHKHIIPPQFSHQSYIVLATDTYYAILYTTKRKYLQFHISYNTLKLKLQHITQKDDLLAYLLHHTQDIPTIYAKLLPLLDALPENIFTTCHIARQKFYK